MERLTIKPSQYKIISQLVMALCCSVSVFSWQDNVLHSQWLIQLLLVISLVGYFCFVLTKGRDNINVELSDRGEWRFLRENQQTQQWQMMQGSRITPWLLWIALSNKASARTDTMLIFKDAIPDPQYRAICRAIQRVRHHR